VKIKITTSAVTCFVRFRRARDPSCLCVRLALVDMALLEGLKAPPGPGIGVPVTRRTGSLHMGANGISQVPGDPSRAFAPPRDPGRTDVVLPWRSHRCCPHLRDSEGFGR
jgi:hypothetical protein